MAPARMPPEVVNKIHDAMVQALARAGRRRLQRDSERREGVIKAAAIKME